MRHLKKRGQVTIFIIIGIILLFSSALIFYIRQQITSATTEIEVGDITTEVPQRSDPIETFVRDCLESVSIEEVRALGLKGGYMDPQRAGLRYNAVRPTRSSLLKISPNGNVYIPFWYEMSSNDKCVSDCVVETHVPPLRKSEGPNSIEEQLEEAIASKISLCLDDFSYFREQGFTVLEAGRPEADVTVSRNDIYVKLDYPLKFAKEGSVSEYKDFSVRLPLNLRKIYELATKVLKLTTSLQFFEGDALNLITAFSDLSEDALPPIYDFRLGAGDFVMWQKSKVAEKIKLILMNHIPMAQVMGTRNYYRHSISDAMVQGMARKMIIFQNASYPFYNVEFTYLGWWPFYLDVKPSTGEIIKPDISSGGPIGSIIPGFGMQQYRFFYDLSFPVLVTISYPEAFNGKGFTMSYAIEANIRQNRPVNGSGAFSPTTFTGETFVCQKETWNSGDYNIRVLDASTGEYLPDVLVSASFGNEGCVLGRTSEGENSSLITKLPVGIGALVFEKEGFGTRTLPIGVGVNSSRNITLKVYPEKQVALKIMKVPYSKQILVNGPSVVTRWVFNATRILELSPKDRAVLQYEQVTTGSQPLSGAIVFDEEHPQGSPITLVPGNYTISVQIFSDREYIIPEDRRCFPSGFLGLGETCETIDSVKMDTLPYGLLNWEGNLTWQVSDTDLYSHENVTFFVPFVAYYDIPPVHRKIEDLQALDTLDKLSEDYRSSLEPQWS
ncbi:hypothetical protein D6764_05190 [Candidatus Woesearchaeota archaeon]|nr:MAG: hypothetical protein D6764_05190 [Candidatus Woesearchaeota archaeon]